MVRDSTELLGTSASGQINWSRRFEPIYMLDTSPILTPEGVALIVTYDGVLHAVQAVLLPMTGVGNAARNSRRDGSLALRRRRLHPRRPAS
jgi:hypothetical protein